MDRINDVKYALGPIALVLAVTLGLIAAAAGLRQRDGRSSRSSAVMVFAAGLPYRYFGGLALGAGADGRRLAWLGSRTACGAWWRSGIPGSRPQGDGFQAVQSMIAVGTGGVTGRGLGYSVQKLFYLP